MEQYLNLIVYYRQITPALFDLLEEEAEIVRFLKVFRAIVVRHKGEDNCELKSALEAHPDVLRVDFDRPTKISLFAAAQEPSDFVTGNDLIFADTRVTEAWDITKGRSDVIVAIADTGVSAHQEDMDCIDSPYYDEPWVTEINNFCFRVDIGMAASYTGMPIVANKPINFFTPDIMTPGDQPITVYFDAAMEQPVPADYVPPTNNVVVYTSQPLRYRLTVISGGNTSYFFSDAICVKSTFDDAGHGTSVASLVGSKHNGKRMSGIAPNCRILAMRTLPRIQTDSLVASAFDKAIAWRGPNGERCRVVNCSWGSTVDQIPAAIYQTAVQRAEVEGIIVVAAAGNWSKDSDTEMDPYIYPAAYATPTNNVVSVGGTGTLLNGIHGRPHFPNRFDKVFISAPSTSLLCAQPNHATYLFNYTDTTPTDDSKYPCAGTSYAAPFTSAVIALLLSGGKDLGRELTPLEVKDILKASANPYITNYYNTVTYDTSTIGPTGLPVGGVGFGVIDACRALRYLRGEIDIRVRTSEKRGAVGTGLSIHVDAGQYAGGSTVVSVKCFENDVLKSTVSNAAFENNFIYTPSVSGATVKVHFTAESSTGQIVTSKPLFFDVAAANVPDADAMRVYNPTTPRSDIAFAQFSYGYHDDPPVLIFSDRLISVRLNSYAKTALTFTKLEVRIDGVLFTTITTGLTFSDSYKTFTLPSMASVAEGFHTLQLTLYTATASTSKTMQMVYSPRTTLLPGVTAFIAKPWTYQNGIFELEYMAISSNYLYTPWTEDTRVTYLAGFRLYFGEELYLRSDYPVGGATHRWHKLRLAIPKPTGAVKVEITGQDMHFAPYYEDENPQAETTFPTLRVSETVIEAAGNGPTLYPRGPMTFAHPPSSRQAAGSTITIQTRPGQINSASQVFYRYTGSGEWNTYSGPFLARTGTLEWYGVNSAGTSEMVNSADYLVPSPPYATPSTGRYPTAQTVALYGTGAIYYTTNGDTPTAASTLYVAPVVIPVSYAPVTLKFIDSSAVVQEAVYTFDPPYITPAGGRSQLTIDATLSGNGAIIYTLDGTDPRHYIPLYEGKATFYEGQVVTTEEPYSPVT